MLEKLKEVNSLVKSIDESPLKNEIFLLLNEADIDYLTWTDLEIIIWYYENHKQG